MQPFLFVIIETSERTIERLTERSRSGRGALALVAVPSSDQGCAEEGSLGRSGVSRLTSDGRDAVVARRDEGSVWKVHHSIQVTDGRDDGCLQLRLGGWWWQFGHTGSLRNEARGLWLPREQAMASNARKLSGVLLLCPAVSSQQASLWAID